MAKIEGNQKRLRMMSQAIEAWNSDQLPDIVNIAQAAPPKAEPHPLFLRYIPSQASFQTSFPQCSQMTFEKRGDVKGKCRALKVRSIKDPSALRSYERQLVCCDYELLVYAQHMRPFS